ncbi:terminase family protein [Pseudoalteromonas sp. NBT06-2]|uniref:terminase large subunit domain-containing protein n=1 Tax=Pseudoalteromonas sp. NBT06-2 TaxID=2025950 RepID=UPI001BB0287E|nr:terminase family protein [Pseudoalteromonas sp. NBT06-2]
MASALDKIKKVAKAVKEAVWGPLEKSGQEIFLMAGQPETLVSELLIHGGRGTGKSEVLIPNYLQHVGKGWGIWWSEIILRREIKSLKDLIKKSKKMIPRAFPGAEYNKSERSWTFVTGEKLTFDFCKTVEDYDEKYHGQEFQYVAFDELTVWPDDKVYQSMRSCLRHSYQPTLEQPLLPPMQTRATTNPYGRGKGWVKEYFITSCQQGVPKFVDGVMDKMHIFCSYIENYKLPDVYKRFLNSIKDPVLRAA